MLKSWDPGSLFSLNRPLGRFSLLVAMSVCAIAKHLLPGGSGDLWLHCVLLILPFFAVDNFDRFFWANKKTLAQKKLPQKKTIYAFFNDGSLGRLDLTIEDDTQNHLGEFGE